MLNALFVISWNVNSGYASIASYFISFDLAKDMINRQWKIQMDKWIMLVVELCILMCIIDFEWSFNASLLNNPMHH